MSGARRYLALALAACKSKQYEEAGVFLAQAAQEDDAEDIAKQLGAVEEETKDAENQDPAEAISADNCDEPVSGTPQDDSSNEDSEQGDDLEDWGDEEGEDEESVSSVTRRKTSSLFHIGKIIAAAMSVSADEEDDSEESEDEDTEEIEEEADPDFVGESLIPASFSSVKVKGVAVKSPVRVKNVK